MKSKDKSRGKKRSDAALPDDTDNTEITPNMPPAQAAATGAGGRHRWTDTLQPHEREILAQRTRLLAQDDKDSAQQGEQVAYIRFRLGASEEYGIPYQYSEEIEYAGGITKVPSTPDFIAGIINRRGEMLTVLDLKAFFKTGKAEHGDDACIIIVSGAGLDVGLLVDSVVGNDSYDPSQLSSPMPSDGVSNMRYIKGIHRGQVTILDMDALLSDPAIRIDERVI